MNPRAQIYGNVQKTQRGFNSKTDDPLAGFSAVPESLCAGICSHAPSKDTGDTEKIIVVVQHEN